MPISVLLPLALDKSYDYLAPHDTLTRGQFVRVPLRRKEVVGVVWQLDGAGAGAGAAALDSKKLRTIIEPIDFVPPLNEELMQFIEWVARWTMTPKGLVLNLAMSPKSLFKEYKRKPKEKKEILMPVSPFPAWTEQQEKAVAGIGKHFKQEKAQPLLLEGITGAGKTEICFHQIINTIEKGGQALLLLPEIALADYMLARFRQYSQEPVAVWHSAMTPAQRRKQWLDIADGKIKIAIGARSALFLPFRNLKLIIVDEEHDEGFKQTDKVIYHARDMALVRASLANIPILLSTATPCLETLHNVKQKKFAHVKVKTRAKPTASLPDIELIDMRQQRLKAGVWLAAPLTEAIKEKLEKKEQTLLFLNRRGYAPLTLCRSCGYRFSCTHCTAWLAEHRARHELLCHYCGEASPLPPSCPQCGDTNSFTACGPGIERILEEVKRLFPQARVACLSRDLPPDLAERAKLIEQMKQGQLDILIGTQIIAKGLHFPRLTLAGVVDADLGLANADLRATERCFQLLQQVAGRTGRENLKGKAYLQTYQPEHNVMLALVNKNSAAFMDAELKARRANLYPPFGKLAAVILSSENKPQLEAYAAAMARKMPKKEGTKVLGPAPAPIFRIANRYRIRFLIKSASALQPFVSTWLKHSPRLPAAIKRQIDIDPHSFL